MKRTVRAAFTVLLLATARPLAAAEKGATGAAPRPAGSAGAPVVPARSTGAAVRPSGGRRPAGGSERLDGIAAVVNDDVILESDVEEQLYLFLLQAHARPDSAAMDTLRRQVLNQLIDFKLLVAEARRQGIALSAADGRQLDAQVEESLKDTKSRFETEEAFQEQLARESMTEAKLREKYRGDLERQLLADRLVDHQFPKRPVPASEAEAYFKGNPDKFPRVPAEVKVQVIQIAPSADSVAVARGRARALEVRKRILAGEKFAKLAGEASDDPNTARAGGDLGYLPRGALDRPLDEVVFSLKLNEPSAPIRSAVGWHIVEVLDRDTVRTAAGTDSLDRQGKPALEAHVRHILIRVPIGDVDVERARTQAERVRAEAARGGDFAALVRRYSQYQGQATADGDLGFVSVTAFQPSIRSGLDTVAVGGVTPVLENSAGFNIFKVNDRKPERAYALDEVRDELPEVVAQIKQRARLDEWVKGLRSKAHIEIRRS